MAKAIAFVYGVVAYLVFFASFLYAIGFVGNIGVPKGIDTGAEGPLAQSLLINVALLALFAVQHSVMARPTFKKWWTRFVPSSVERSTYVLLSSLVLLLMFWQWRPLPGVVWDVSGGVVGMIVLGLFGVGWLIVLLSTFMIGHFELFGLSQVFLRLRGKVELAASFKKPGFYKYVRHPIMLGFLIAFWATPTMTYGHLLFAVGTTGYILIALQLEERNLVEDFGDEYREYKRDVSQLVPTPRRK